MDGKYTARLRFRTAANEDRTCCAEWTGAEPKLIIYKDGTRREVVVSMQEGGWNAPAYEQFRFQGKTEDTACQLRLLRLPDAGNDEFNQSAPALREPRDQVVHVLIAPGAPARSLGHRLVGVEAGQQLSHLPRIVGGPADG